MIRQLFFGLLFSTLCTGLYAQSADSRLDINAQRLAYQYNHRLKPCLNNNNPSNHSAFAGTECKNAILQQLNREFVIEEGAFGLETGAFISVDEKTGADMAHLERLHATVQTRAGAVWTVRVPLEHLEDLGTVKGVIQVSGDVRVFPVLDLSIKDTKTDSVHNGTDLPRPYKGKDVLVGIVDGGFDFTHPTFRKSDGTKDIRFISFWNQAVNGTRPQGFSYGSEIQGAENILTQEHDQSGDQSHATHVTSIASGVGAPGMPEYQGVAPEAEIIGVRTNFSVTGIVNGVQYCYNQANKIGKPIAVNLSIGGRSGPRDGTSAADRAFDGMVARGNILCGAAGNSGSEKYHIRHAFTTLDTVRTIVNNVDGGRGRIISAVDIWSDVDKTFQARIMLYDSMGKAVRQVTNFISSSRITPYREDSFRLQGNTWISYALAGVSNAGNPFNKRSQITLYALAPQELKAQFVLEIVGENTGIHAWNIAGGAEFSNTFPNGEMLEKGIAGDSSYTITEIGGTAKKIITAGAHTVRRRYINLKGEDHEIWKPADAGELAPFSGIGPSLDGRTKPDLTAPGNTINGAISSFDNGYPEQVFMKEYAEGDKKWKFALSHGTSMASPHLTGTVALMLEILPTLNYEEIHPIIINAARKDQFTGAIPQTGVYNWGWGKLNTWQAIKDLLASPLSQEVIPSLEKSRFFCAPNPASGQTTVHAVLFPLGESVLKITDLSGRVLKQEKIILQERYQELPLDVSALSAGCYLIRLESGSVVKTEKMMVE